MSDSLIEHYYVIFMSLLCIFFAIIIFSIGLLISYLLLNIINYILFFIIGYMFVKYLKKYISLI